jgi:hypothetical protein
MLEEEVKLRFLVELSGIDIILPALVIEMN